MSELDLPAGSTGGPTTVSAGPTASRLGEAEIPPKMRVHALAKLLSVSSREVLAALADLGVEARGPQSSVDRAAALQVVDALLPDDAVEDITEEVDLTVSGMGGGAALAPLFAPPQPMFLPPEPVAVTRRRSRPATPAVDMRAQDEPAEDEPADATPEDPEDAVEESDLDDDSSSEDGEGAASRRRRRRGRRGRGRGKGGENGDAEDSESDSDSDDDDDDDDQDGARPAAASGDSAESADESDDDDEEDDETSGRESTGRRRRRRRRRKGTGEDGKDDADGDDPPLTVTHVRESRGGDGRASDGRFGDGRSGDSRASDSRDDGDGVQGVRGSTRLEAKRQRRRDGRDAGRRRPPILSEAEFLARRESVERSMVVRQHGDRIEMAVLEDGVLVEYFVTNTTGGALVGNIYLGRVQNVLPSMEAAFVDIGRGRNAVLYAGEVDWDAAGLAGKSRRIEQALSSGDSVLVQVTKDPIGHKGARLTTQISLAGRFLVYVPSGGATGISRKLPELERKRLKDLLKQIVPDDAGVIIRTASEGVSHEALERDVRRLQAQWEVVKTRTTSGDGAKGGKPKAPQLLYEEPDLLIKVVRDQFNEDFTRLVVSGEDAWDTLQNYVGHVAPELAERLQRHVGPADVFAEHRIDEQLIKALDRKVWLPSGGTLVIDRTEAMTVIDVNTGKYTGSGGNLEETVTRNNLEAAEEIVRQLRLRDIGGIIVIDFIDMVLEANRDLVLRRLTECLGRDRTRHQVAEVTSLGLVQMTRKRVGAGLLEAFSTPCEHCRGRGVIVSTEPMAVQGDSPADSGSEPRRSKGRGRRGADGPTGNGAAEGAEPSGNGRRGGRGGQAAQRANGQEHGGTGQTPAPAVAAGTPEPEVATSKPSAASEPMVTDPVASEPMVTDPVASEPATSEPMATEAAATEAAAPEPEAVEAEAPQAEAPRAEVAVAEVAVEPPTSGVEPENTTAPAVPRSSNGHQVAEPAHSNAWPADDLESVDVPPARPARRRRRAASRPAGPPTADA